MLRDTEAETLSLSLSLFTLVDYMYPVLWIRPRRQDVLLCKHVIRKKMAILAPASNTVDRIQPSG